MSSVVRFCGFIAGVAIFVLAFVVLIGFSFNSPSNLVLRVLVGILCLFLFVGSGKLVFNCIPEAKPYYIKLKIFYGVEDEPRHNDVVGPFDNDWDPRKWVSNLKEIMQVRSLRHDCHWLNAITVEDEIVYDLSDDNNPRELISPQSYMHKLIRRQYYLFQ